MSEAYPEFAAKMRDYLADRIVYRGQWCGRDALAWCGSTIPFGDAETASLYAAEPNDRTLSSGRTLAPAVFAARLTIEAPFASPDPFFDLDEIGAEFGRDVIHALVRDHRQFLVETGGFEELQAETGYDLEEMVAAWPDGISHLPPLLAFRAFETPEFRRAVEAAGYDGTVFMGTGENAGEMEFHAFSPEQAVSAISGLPLTPDAEEAPETGMEFEMAP